MSEPAQEPQTEPTEPVEPVEPTVPPVEPTEPQEPAEAPGEEEEPEQIEGPGEPAPEQPADVPEQPQALSEKALKERDDKLDKENRRHAARLSEIMGEAANDLIPCPICMDGIAGWVYLPEATQLSDEAILRIRQLIGLSGLEGIKQANFAEQCPECDGQGEVRTGSRVAGYETTTCERCNKTGWVRTDGVPANGRSILTEVTAATGPTVYGTEEPDPEVLHLRERGFTVIPPMVVNQQG